MSKDYKNNFGGTSLHVPASGKYRTPLKRSAQVRAPFTGCVGSVICSLTYASREVVSQAPLLASKTMFVPPVYEPYNSIGVQLNYENLHLYDGSEFKEMMSCIVNFLKLIVSI